VESTKSINEILTSLKNCFGDLELDVTSEKQAKPGVIKVRASPTTKKKKPTLKVEVSSGEGGNVNVKFRKPQGVDQGDFTETMQKLEESFL